MVLNIRVPLPRAFGRAIDDLALEDGTQVIASISEVALGQFEQPWLQAEVIEVRFTFHDLLRTKKSWARWPRPSIRALVNRLLQDQVVVRCEKIAEGCTRQAPDTLRFPPCCRIAQLQRGKGPPSLDWPHPLSDAASQYAP